MSNYWLQIECGGEGPTPLVINCGGEGPQPLVTFNGRSLNCGGERVNWIDPAHMVIMARERKDHRAPREETKEGRSSQYSFVWRTDAPIQLAGSGLQIGVINGMSLTISTVGKWNVNFTTEFYCPTTFWMDLYGFVEGQQSPVANIAIPPSDYSVGGSFHSPDGSDATLLPLLDKFLYWSRYGQGRLLYPQRGASLHRPN